jgi:hypothetical protein
VKEAISFLSIAVFFIQLEKGESKKINKRNNAAAKKINKKFVASFYIHHHHLDNGILIITKKTAQHFQFISLMIESSARVFTLLLLHDSFNLNCTKHVN